MARSRITDKDLQSLCDTINELTGSPKQAYSKGADGKHRANIGNFHISGAYGGVNVHRMSNEGGGINTPLGGGYHTKRELYEKLNAYIGGLQMAKEAQQ